LVTGQGSAIFVTEGSRVAVVNITGGCILIVKTLPGALAVVRRCGGGGILIVSGVRCGGLIVRVAWQTVVNLIPGICITRQTVSIPCTSITRQSIFLVIIIVIRGGWKISG